MRILLILVCLCLSSQVALSQFKYPSNSDSLKVLINETKSDTTKIRALTYLGLNYKNSKEESLPLYKQAFRIASRKKDSAFMAYSYGNIATVYYYSTQYDSALFYMDKELGIRRKLKNQKAYIAALNNVGILYRKLNNLPGALACFQERLSYEQKNGDSLGVAEVYNNMANLYDQYGDRQKALKLSKSSLKLRIELKDSSGMASSYNNIATTYNNLKQYDSAVFYYEKSLDLAHLVESRSFYGNILNNIGHGYYLIGKDSLAEHYLKLALESRTDIGFYFGIGQTQNNLASLYFKRGQFDKAFALLQQSLEISVKYGHTVIEKDASLYLSKVYFELGDYRKAYTHLRRTKDLADSIQASSQTREYAQMEYAYQYKQKHIADSLENASRIAIELKQEELRQYKEEQEKKRQKFRYWVAIGIGLVMAVVSLILFRGYRQKAKSNKLIQIQKNEIEGQKDILQERNKEITDSINYAKRIQSAILPPLESIKESFPNSFVLYQPKDIVAGDFYWLEKTDEATYLAVADCTGHGVPGAMVSVICNNGLNRSVREYGAKTPGEILDKTRDLVINEFEKSDGSINNNSPQDTIKDGMDIALCSLSFARNGKQSENGSSAYSALEARNRSVSNYAVLLKYAGANNPLWIIRKGSNEIEEIKGNKQPIGSYDGMEPFSTHDTVINEGDTIYMFSDGFADQFGGEKGKKLKNSNFKKLVLSLQDKSMDEQFTLISQAFIDWMKDYEQLDDVCVIGVRV